MPLRYLLLLVFFVSINSEVDAQRTFYVDPDASSPGDGSAAHPFRSMDDLNALRLRGMDRVVFRPGSVMHGRFSPTLDSAFGEGSLFIGTETDSMPATIVADSTEAIRLVGTANIVVANLRLKGAGRKTGSRAAGLLAWDCTRTYFLDLDISGFQKAGLGIYGCRMAVVSRVDAHDNGSAGIEVGGMADKRSRNLVIRDCRAWSNPGDPTNFDNHSGNGIVVGQVNQVEIVGCTAWDNGADMPRIGNGPVGIWAWEADTVEIRECVSFGNHTSKGSSDGGGFDLDGGVAHAKVHHNLSHDNEGSGLGIFQYWGASPWYDNQVAFNYSIDDATTTAGAAGILIWSSDTSAANMRGLDLHDNTIVNRTTALVRYHEDSRHLPFNVHDNSFYGPGPMPAGDPGKDVFKRNRWCRSGCPVPEKLIELKDIRDASNWRKWLEAN